MSLAIDCKTTALVLIDLQRGVVARPTAPRTGAAVVKNAVRLLSACREKKVLIVLVHVEYRDPKERLNLEIDAPPLSTGVTPTDWSEFVRDVAPQPGDLVITKRQWGAFYGTELDLQLRRRGIRTLILGGISTNFGVESTARNANERGYEQIFVEDAMAGLTADGHRATIENIFPRLGRIRSTEELLQSLSA